MQALRSSDLPLAYRLDGSGLIASLPYADAAPERQEHKSIKKLILEEWERYEDKLPASNEDLPEEIETPVLDAFAQAHLGKRDQGKQKEVSLSEYERAVVEIEQMKTR